MITNETKGNLITMGLKGELDVIVHGANCFHKMGSGIAAEIARRIPEAAMSDRLTVYGSKEKLGTFSSTFTTGYRREHKLLVINGYTQYPIGRNVDYRALFDLFSLLNTTEELRGLKIGVPLIGCGIAGGDWEYVKQLIKVTTPNLDITVVHYVPPKTLETL